MATRPTRWTERESPAAFVGWLAPSRSDALPFALLAAMAWVGVLAWVLSPQGKHFGFRDIETIIPISSALIALVPSYRALTLLLNRPTFRVEGGRFTYRGSPIPEPGTVSVPLVDVVTFRASNRVLTGKRGTFKLWDIVIDARDGKSHRVKLSLVSPDEAAWLAQRLATAHRALA